MHDMMYVTGGQVFFQFRARFDIQKLIVPKIDSDSTNLTKSITKQIAKYSQHTRHDSSMWGWGF